MNLKSLERYIKKNPVTFMFLVIIIIYFIVISLNGGTTDGQTLLKFGAFYPINILLYNQYYRFVTSIFIHIGAMHLLFNSYALYIFGTQIERLMGHKKFLLFFLFSGIGANIVTFFFSNPGSLSAGASGSLFGLFGVFLYLIRHHKEIITPEGRKSIISLLVVNLVFTILVPNISITAHLGGLVIGYLLSFIFIK